MRPALTWLGAAAAVLLVGAGPAPGATVVSSPVHTLAAGAREPMLLPTGVAVDALGRAWIADGARDRVLVFGADGGLAQTLRRGAGAALSRPMGVAAGADGRVWVADAGNNRLVAFGIRTATETAYPLDKTVGKADLTDVEVSADGKLAYAVDNDGSRVLTLDVATGKWSAQGGRGAGWGSFNHPRSIAVDAQGRAFVTDVLNGRVLRLDAGGRSGHPVVKYGVYPGQVFRPSGVDVEGQLLYVADSVLGVVQVYTLDGALVDAVRDASGSVLHLEGPLGIEVVGDRLYVVESTANRVAELTIRAGGGVPLVATTVKVSSTTQQQGQECTLCHLDFIPPLDDGVATALVSPPKKVGGQSWAGAEAACISCHDGSVLDSRRHIWSGYAHPRGADAVIPASMIIPKEIPLVNGQITCRTCHSPHSLGGSAQKTHGATMIRSEGHASDLCVACHGSKGGM